MAKITLDEEFVDETTKIVAMGFGKPYPPELGMNVGFCLAFRFPASDRPDRWFFQLLQLNIREEPERFRPAAERLYQRVIGLDGVRADLTFEHCAM